MILGRLFGLIILSLAMGACSANAQPTTLTTRVSEVDGMEQAFVPAGPFLMGSRTEDALAQSDEMPQRSVSLDAFWIDQTEVTNAQYARCVEAGACRPPLHSRRHGREELAQHPVLGVTWYEAGDYCAWAGRRLPSEAEWEKAARGEDGRTYPWGEQTPSEELANFDKRFGETVAVGSFPQGASPYGALDMAGNAWEWVADTYDPVYYAGAPDRNPPGPPESVNWRVVRGGAWNVAPQALRSANRSWSFPLRDYFDGFRCASDP